MQPVRDTLIAAVRSVSESEAMPGVVYPIEESLTHVGAWGSPANVFVPPIHT
jgi:hypothetical protein